MKSYFPVGFAILLGFSSPSPSAGQASDHPVIKPMPRSQLIPGQSHEQNFASYAFIVKEGKKTARVEKEGYYRLLRYLIKDNTGRIDKTVGRQEIVRNYKLAAREKGGAILYETAAMLTFTLLRKDGGTTWASVRAGDGSYHLYIIDEQGFEQQLTFGAEEMKRALDRDGHVAVYGIHFDVDRATLAPGAEKVLVEMVKLLKNSPALRIEIQGHTDNTGSAAHNLELSQRRAETVKVFLQAFGIDSARLLPKGYGAGQPVAANDTEEGRAKNRRVELVTF